MKIVTVEWSGEKILEIDVGGKRGVGYCVSTTGAVPSYEGLRDRPKPVAVGASAPRPGEELARSQRRDDPEEVEHN